MAATMQPLLILSISVAVLSLPAPTPGRIPKVYNALITSNQNLEPSKAYPVYQPVLHDFAFPYQPAVFYGDFPIGNGLQRIPSSPPKEVDVPKITPSQEEIPQQPAGEKPVSTENPPPVPSNPGEDKSTPAPPLPPNTESPIPLNQFGLPPQVLPLGRIDPAYNGYNQIGPFYSYPSVRFYDPFDPFSFNPYVNLPPLYRPLTNVIEQRNPGFPIPTTKSVQPAVVASVPPPQGSQPPPAEPSDLNVLNYASKDPAIPNVPPPPLPQGGLKSDESE